MFMLPPRVDLHGSPYEIGIQHGSLLRPQIQKQLAFYKSLFKETAKMDWETDVLKVAEEFNQTLECLTPELHEEIRGIADGYGSGVNVLDIVALNCRSEIALGMFSDGCTSVAWKTGNKQYLCQNWDWSKEVKENLVIMSITQVGKPKIVMVTEPGIIGKIGFNSSSVGTCLNAIRAKPTHTDKLPVHILLRLCLQSTSVKDAINTLEKFGSSSSQHIMIADIPNGARGLEISPLGNVVLKPRNVHRPGKEDNILVHTNHFIENKTKGIVEPPWLSGSPIRLSRASEIIESLISESHKEITPGLIRTRIFTDTYNAPQAICCQEDPTRSRGNKIMTLFNIVMIFEEGAEPKAEVYSGRPGFDDGELLNMGLQDSLAN